MHYFIQILPDNQADGIARGERVWGNNYTPLFELFHPKASCPTPKIFLERGADISSRYL